MHRVLVVDDEPAICRAASRVLVSQGYEVVLATDGNEALRLIDCQHFDLALVDYMMPNGPFGDVVLRVLRERDPGCARVFMTAVDDLDLWKKVMNEPGVAKALSKPFGEDVLVNTVADALRETEDARATFRQRDGLATTRRQWQVCLDEQLLSLAIQPIVQAPWPHGLTAVECLIRSRHPVLSRPDILLNAVESLGVVFDFGAEVNRLAARWAERIPPEVLLFVNVHPGQFADPQMMRTFEPLLPHAHRVVLEITERSDLLDNEDWEHQVEELTGAGFQFALDDLGAGYNSLVMLAELRPTYIKIDMSITRGVHLKQRKQSLVELISKFAQANGERVVGEGVETEEEAAVLRRCGVDLLQGYLYGRPSAEWPIRGN